MQRLSALCRMPAIRHLSMSAATRSSEVTVGFIGLGQMGMRMARNLGKDTKIVLHDVFPDTARALASQLNKATVAPTVAEVAEQADVVITMLPANAEVEQVYAGESGVFSAAKKNALLIDASTVDPIFAKRLAQQATSIGVRMVDAPVSGGVGGAEAATLTFMVGGETANFEAAKPFLQKMGKNIVHCGANGNGQVAKVCNNMLLGISMVGTAEAMALGRRLGMDPKVLANIINTSSGRCWSSELYNPCPGVLENSAASRGYTGGFASKLMAKDLRLAMSAANEIKSSVPLGAMASQLFNIHCTEEASANKDFSSIFEMLTGGNNKK